MTTLKLDGRKRGINYKVKYK